MNEQTSKHGEQIIQILKDCCKRDWKDESLLQVATIVSNAMYWRNEEIRLFRYENAELRKSAQGNPLARAERKEGEAKHG